MSRFSRLFLIAAASGRRGLTRQIARHVVRITVRFPALQPVFIVIAGDGGTVFLRPVAVGVVAPGGAHAFDCRGMCDPQRTARTIGVRSCWRLNFLRLDTKFI